MNLPSYYLDPLTFGDVRAGAESLPGVQDDSRQALSLSWLGGLIISQGQPGLQGEWKDLHLDDKPVGTWTVDATVTGKPKSPDLMQKAQLIQDGKDILEVLMATDKTFGLAPDTRIWRLSSLLLIRTAIETQTLSWHFPTPLGRSVNVVLQAQTPASPA